MMKTLNTQKPNQLQEEQHQYTIYSDGACSTNHMKTDENSHAGWAAVVLMNDKLYTEVTGKLEGKDATNNRAELTAAIRGLQCVPEGDYVHLFTDSKYVIQCITDWLDNWKKNGWKSANKKPVKNVDLIKVLDELYQNRFVQMTWVKGHSGNELNERADTLAKEAMMMNN